MRKVWSFIWKWTGDILRVKALWGLLPSGVSALLIYHFARLANFGLWVTVPFSVGVGVLLFVIMRGYQMNHDSNPEKPKDVAPMPKRSKPTSLKQTMVSSPGGQQAGRDIINNPAVTYSEPESTIKTKLSTGLARVRYKYADKHINVMVAPESGNSQRQRVASFIGSLLHTHGLGFFEPSMIFMGNFPDRPVTLVCRPEDVPIAEDLLDALSVYMSDLEMEIIDLPSNSLYTMELYIYGTPTFKPNGQVIIK